MLIAASQNAGWQLQSNASTVRQVHIVAVYAMWHMHRLAAAQYMPLESLLHLILGGDQEFLSTLLFPAAIIG